MYRVEKVMFTCKERDIPYTCDATLRHVMRHSIYTWHYITSRIHVTLHYITYTRDTTLRHAYTWHYITSRHKGKLYIQFDMFHTTSGWLYRRGCLLCWK